MDPSFPEVLLAAYMKLRLPLKYYFPSNSVISASELPINSNAYHLYKYFTTFKKKNQSKIGLWQ